MTLKQKMPAILFYTGDWLKDPAVRCVSLPARGLWIDMLCLMYESPNRGYLSLASGKAVEPTQLARMVGTSTEDIENLLKELHDCGVYSLDERGVIFSRRMVEDEIRRQNKSKAGKRGMRSRYKKEDNDDSVSTSVITEPITEPQQNDNRPDNKPLTPLEYEYEYESVSNSELYTENQSIEKAWKSIPKNRRIGRGKFARIWIVDVIHTGLDQDMVIKAMCDYYDSERGRGKHHRQPATLISDRIWDEEKSMWRENRGEMKFPENIHDQEKIVKIYTEKSEENKQKVDTLLERGHEVGRIAYKIWEKHEDIRMAIC